MGRQSLNRGFTLTEVCIVLLILSFMTLVTLRIRPVSSVQRSVFAMRYLDAQSEAIRSSSAVSYTDEETGEEVHFNGSGNTDSPHTIVFPDGHRLIIELSGGRLVFR